MATFTDDPKKGWKKVKYSKGDGTYGYFYSHPNNSPKDVEHHKRALTQVAVGKSIEDKIPGKARTGTGTIAGKIVAPRGYGDSGWDVRDIVGKLKRRRKEEKRKKNLK